MRFLLFVFFIFIPYSFSSEGEDVLSVIRAFDKGEYAQVLKLIPKVRSELTGTKNEKVKKLGTLSYLEGISFARESEYDLAKKSFNKAITLKHDAKDLYYEYAQTLYALDELKLAQKAFYVSLKKKYKPAVSMYYIAIIYQQRKRPKRAATYYENITKLSDAPKQVLQAAFYKLADIYLDSVEKEKSAVSLIEKLVIPKYEQALEVDEKSVMAKEIKAKIELLQKRYDLVLFQLRNGRPTNRPPFFLKTSLTYEINDNVNSISEDSKESLTDAQVESSSRVFTVFGRYSFYPNKKYSITPQVNFIHTKYNSNEDEIIANDNYTYTLSVQGSYEHMYKERPASFFIELGLNGTQDDADADGTLENADTGWELTFSENLQFFANMPSIFRLRHNKTDAEEETSSNQAWTLIYEQLVLIEGHILYFYNSYAKTVYDDNASDTNAFTARVDWITPTIPGWVTFNPYVSMTSTDYPNDTRGTNARTYGVNIYRNFNRHWYVFFDYARTAQTGIDESDDYSQNVVKFNVDYIY